MTDRCEAGAAARRRRSRLVGGTRTQAHGARRATGHQRHLGRRDCWSTCGGSAFARPAAGGRPRADRVADQAGPVATRVRSLSGRPRGGDHRVHRRRRRPPGSGGGARSTMAQGFRALVRSRRADAAPVSVAGRTGEKRARQTPGGDSRGSGTLARSAGRDRARPSGEWGAVGPIRGPDRRPRARARRRRAVGDAGARSGASAVRPWIRRGSGMAARGLGISWPAPRRTVGDGARPWGCQGTADPRQAKR